MKTAQAAYETVHQYTEGVEALANAIGIKSKQVLINKVNTNPNKSHHLTLNEASLIMRKTGDDRIIHALADEMGGVYIPGDRSGDARSITVMNDLSKMSQEFGALIQEVASDIQDGIISDNEYKRIENDANKLRVALATLIADLSAMNAETHYRYVR